MWRALPSFSLLGAAVCSLLVAVKTRPERDEQPTFRVVVGLVPPHMNENGSGREAEYLTHLLGKSPTFYVPPFTRHWNSFQDDARYDAVATVPAEMVLGRNESTVFLSKAYIQYQNGIGYDPDAFGGDVDPSNLAQLAGRRVAAFAGAADIVVGLRANIAKFAQYIEVKDQRVQSTLLQERKVDAVIEDELIFRC
jgi:hypothetical protein